MLLELTTGTTKEEAKESDHNKMGGGEEDMIDSFLIKPKMGGGEDNMIDSLLTKPK